MAYPKKKSFTFKDSSRVWWKLTITRLSKFKTEFGFKHYQWEYELVNQTDTDSPVNIHYGMIQGQYDVTPDVYDCMLDYLNTQNALAIGFTRHGTEIK